jgi:hypothetical protein
MAPRLAQTGLPPGEVVDERLQRHRPAAPLPAKSLGIAAPALHPQGRAAPPPQGQAIAMAAHHSRQRLRPSLGMGKRAPAGRAAPQAGGGEALR